MAGDWLKIRTDLPDDPAVIGVARELAIPQDQVVGILVRFWSWVDHHLSGRDDNVTVGASQGRIDCVTAGVTGEWLDEHLRRPGFAAALEKHGWLALDNGEVLIPKFERHFSKSAKTRALTQKRNRRHRSRHEMGERHAGDDCVTLEASPEKRREEKRIRERETRARSDDSVTVGASPERDLWHELQQPPFGFRSHAKITGILERGVTSADVDAWKAHAREHGEAAATGGIQAYRNPDAMRSAKDAALREGDHEMVKRSLETARARQQARGGSL